MYWNQFQLSNGKFPDLLVTRDHPGGVCGRDVEYDDETDRAQRDSIRSQPIHAKGTAYGVTKYQTFLTKYGI